MVKRLQKWLAKISRNFRKLFGLNSSTALVGAQDACPRPHLKLVALVWHKKEAQVFTLCAVGPAYVIAGPKTRPF